VCFCHLIIKDYVLTYLFTYLLTCVLFCCVQVCDLEHELDCYGNGSKCVAIESQCDGITDCPNGKDESVDLCGKPDEGID